MDLEAVDQDKQRVGWNPIASVWRWLCSVTWLLFVGATSYLSVFLAGYLLPSREAALIYSGLIAAGAMYATWEWLATEPGDEMRQAAGALACALTAVIHLSPVLHPGGEAGAAIETYDQEGTRVLLVRSGQEGRMIERRFTAAVWAAIGLHTGPLLLCLDSPGGNYLAAAITAHSLALRGKVTVTDHRCEGACRLLVPALPGARRNEDVRGRLLEDAERSAQSAPIHPLTLDDEKAIAMAVTGNVFGPLESSDDLPGSVTTCGW